MCTSIATRIVNVLPLPDAPCDIDFVLAHVPEAEVLTDYELVEHMAISRDWEGYGQTINDIACAETGNEAFTVMWPWCGLEAMDLRFAEVMGRE